MSAPDEEQRRQPKPRRRPDGPRTSPGAEALTAALAELSPARRMLVLRGLSVVERRGLNAHFGLVAHRGQAVPDGDWRVWVIRAGRGFGKTRAGAEWVLRMARADRSVRIALVGATASEVRQVMVEGPSGLLRVAPPHERLRWTPTSGQVRFPSGAVAQVYSAANGEALRGPEHNFAWCDELGKWRNGTVAWDNLMLGMRKGDNPQVLVTTTPRGTELFQHIIRQRKVTVVGHASGDNPHLPDAYLEAIEDQYRGSNFGRQEIDGELIDDLEGAMWTRAMLEACRVTAPPPLRRVVVGVDPSVGGGHGDACGIVIVGLGADDRGYVLGDVSLAAAPERWARQVAEAVAVHRADAVVVEVNQGGALVGEVLKAAGLRLQVRPVFASRNKQTRAEPVSTLYDTDKVRHVGLFAQLEDEMCGMIRGGGYEGPGRSPDRADALVWALTDLLLGPRPAAAVRSLG